MELISELLEKSYKIKLNLFEDQRGDFLKIFNNDLFATMALILKLMKYIYQHLPCKF